MNDKMTVAEALDEITAWWNFCDCNAKITTSKDDVALSVLREALAERDALKGTKEEWFSKGRESVLRNNQSGCCCLFNEQDEIVSLCAAHKEREDALKADLAAARPISAERRKELGEWLSLWRRMAECENEEVEPQEEFCHCCYAFRTTDAPEKYTNRACAKAYSDILFLLDAAQQTPAPPRGG